jgi:colicin import membrane protein
MQDYISNNGTKNGKTFLKFFLFSAVTHITLFFIFVQSPFQAAERVTLPASINVTIKTNIKTKPKIKRNSIIKKKQKIVKSKKKVKKKRLRKRIKKTKRKNHIKKKKKNTVNLKKKKKVAKKKVKKKKVKKNEIKNGFSEDEKQKQAWEKLKQARERIQNKLSVNSDKNKLEDVYKRLRSTVKKDSKLRETEISNKAKTLGKIRAKKIKEYQNYIALIIEKNWSYNEQLSKSAKSLETLIVFKVMPDGTIKDIIFEKESDDDYLNESAYKAIIKSNPVSPHPRGIAENFVLIPLKFTPSGIN